MGRYREKIYGGADDETRTSPERRLLAASRPEFRLLAVRCLLPVSGP